MAKPDPVLLSHVLKSSTPVYPAAPRVEIAPHRLIKQGFNYNSYRVTLFNHCGTHVDAPRHVYDDGPSLVDLELKDFFFESPMVIDLGHDQDGLIGPGELAERLEPNATWDFVALRTGFGSIRDGDPTRYSHSNPGLSAEGARWLVANLPELRGVGLDVISVTPAGFEDEGWEAHRILLNPRGNVRLVVEDMKLPEGLPRLQSLWVVPILIEGVDSCWCTVLGNLA